jgi:hypothetical protein
LILRSSLPGQLNKDLLGRSSLVMIGGVPSLLLKNLVVRCKNDGIVVVEVDAAAWVDPKIPLPFQIDEKEEDGDVRRNNDWQR